MWQERVGAPEFGGTRSGRRVRAGARQAPPERAHAAAPPAHAAPDVSQVPPLWTKGGTPRVDERGRLVASHGGNEYIGGESERAAPQHSSPLSVASLSGSDAAESTMELSVGGVATPCHARSLLAVRSGDSAPRRARVCLLPGPGNQFPSAAALRSRGLAAGGGHGHAWAEMGFRSGGLAP